YDGQALIDLARLGQNFARLVRPKRAEAAHSLDFRVLKGRERLLPPRFNDRLLLWRHARCLGGMAFPRDFIWTVSRLPEPSDSFRSAPRSSAPPEHKASQAP